MRTASRTFLAAALAAFPFAWGAAGAASAPAAVPSPEGAEAVYAAPDPANARRLKLWRRVQDALPALMDRQAEAALAGVADAETKSALARRLAARRQQAELTLSEIDDWDVSTADEAAAADVAERLRAQISPFLADLADARSYASGNASPYALGAVRAQVSADVLSAQKALLDALAAWGFSDAWTARTGSFSLSLEAPGLSLAAAAPNVTFVTNPFSDGVALGVSASAAASGAALPGAGAFRASYSGAFVSTGFGAYLATDSASASADPAFWRGVGVDAQGLAQLLGVLRGNVLHAAPDALFDGAQPALAWSSALSALGRAPAFAAQRVEADGSVSLGWDPAFLALLSDAATEDSAQSAALLNLDGSSARRLPDGSLRWDLASDAASGSLSARRTAGGWAFDAALSGGAELRLAASPSSFSAKWSAADAALAAAQASWDGTRLTAFFSGTAFGKAFSWEISGPFGAGAADLAVTADGRRVGTVAWSSDAEGRETFSADLSLPSLGAAIKAKWSGKRSAGSAPVPPAGRRVEFGGFTDGIN